MFERNDNGVYRGPLTRNVAINGGWFVAKIVDTSQLFKGVVEVGGGYKVAPDEAGVTRHRQ